MNNFTMTQRQLHRKQPLLIHISDIVNQCRQKKSSNTSQSSQKNIRPKKLELLRPQLQEFPQIFTKRQRVDYSGYKQYNLNKSKLVCLGESRKQKQLKQPSRKYEINLKNIIKLKKRYSLQPTHFKSGYRDKKVILREKQIRSSCQQQILLNRTSQQLKLRQLMKNILLNHNLKQKIPVNQTKHINGCTSQRQYQQNTTNFQRYKSQIYTESSEREINHSLQNANSFKFSLQKVDISNPKSKKKSKIINNTQQNINSNNSEIQKQLCGWQNMTIYDMTNKSILQQKFILPRTKIHQDL